MKTYSFSARMQRGGLFSTLSWSFYMCAYAVYILHDVWMGKSAPYESLSFLASVCFLIGVVIAPLNILGFCTTFHLDEAGITQKTPCMAPVHIEWNDVEELRLRMFGLQIKGKNRRKPLRISIHLDDFNALWKIIEENSGKRAQ